MWILNKSLMSLLFLKLLPIIGFMPVFLSSQRSLIFGNHPMEFISPYFMPGGPPPPPARVPYDAELDRLECLEEEAQLKERSRTGYRLARRASFDSVSDRLAEGADISFLSEQGYLDD